jgi:hypothetical protein
MAKKVATKAVKAAAKVKGTESEFPNGLTEKQLLALSVEMNKVMDLDPQLNEDEVDLEQIMQEAGDIRPADFTGDEDAPHFSDAAKATLKALGISVPGAEPKLPAKAVKAAKATVEDDGDEDEPKAKVKKPAKDDDDDDFRDEPKPNAKAKKPAKGKNEMQDDDGW